MLKLLSNLKKFLVGGIIALATQKILLGVVIGIVLYVLIDAYYGLFIIE